MSILICPVCGMPLTETQSNFCCTKGHSFDRAKEGYVNLLISGKSGDLKGDNKEMARSRRDFLNKGFYSPLAKAVSDCVGKLCTEGDTVLDICCGEGYYTEYASRNNARNYLGFDISKNMVRLAAKRRCGASFFVANIASIPVKDNSVSLAFHLFAPFHEAEFSRVLKQDGTLITVIPGREHLYGLKKVLYDTPYYNDEKPPQTSLLHQYDSIRVRADLRLDKREDISALFQMTPYYYHTPSEGMRKLEQLDVLETEIDFLLLLCKK